MIKNKIEGITSFKYSKRIENIEFEKNIIIDDFVLIYAKNKIKIGNFVHIASFTSITGGDKLELCDFSAISQGCRILTATDDFKYGGFGNSTITNNFRNIKHGPIKIGKICIVGANSVILPNVEIGEGATIGANSVVTRSLDPWGIYIGNKKVGERDKEKVLKNFESFNLLPKHDQIGTQFK